MSDRLLAEKFDAWIAHEKISDAERRMIERAFFVGAGITMNLIAANISEEQLFERMKSLVAELRNRLRTTKTSRGKR